MLVGPYANGKTMIAERFAVGHLRTAEQQRVWVVQTREGAGLTHFYGSILQALHAPTGSSRDVGRKAEQVDHLLDRLKPKILIFDEAVSNLDQQTAEHLAKTINRLKGKATMILITHYIPRGLQVVVLLLHWQLPLQVGALVMP